ncbi:MAG TPA: sporulation peptidase YabG [Syntrophaceticus sp.]|nr:sporulation peptidase YabG [Syntrophaceticus sp.]
MIIQIKTGDIVARRSYHQDILFRVDEIFEDGSELCAQLRGVFVRLYASAPLVDLEKKSHAEVILRYSEFLRQKRRSIRKAISRQANRSRITSLISGKKSKGDFFEIPGRVLHLEGDRQYVDRCLKTYLRLAVPCQVIYVAEDEQPKKVYQYLQEHRPDILVLTGHDAVKKGVRDYRSLDNYKNSEYFIEAVRRAREFERNKDDLIIIAGGCQSYFEALIEAGANFASSPERIMIDVLDPVFIAERLAYTSIYEGICLQDILEEAGMGVGGIGGIQTRGKMRLGAPVPRF